MDTVTSSDGTTIAYDRLGDGPPVVLVSGGSTDRQANAGLAAELAGRHTVYNYDRRGRGDSGDTQPYAIAREVEDIAAVIGAAGGRANLYGTSSGAALTSLFRLGADQGAWAEGLDVAAAPELVIAVVKGVRLIPDRAEAVLAELERSLLGPALGPPPGPRPEGG